MNNIVACVDGASYTESVCDYAAWAAIRLGAPLEFLHVLTTSADTRMDASGSIGLGAMESLLTELAVLDEQRSVLAREHGRRLLETARQRALEAGVEDADARYLRGGFVETLLELEEHSRLYVLGQHDYQAKPARFLLDHNLEGAIRALHRPVLVTSAQFKAPATFMIAFDASATGRKMVEMVADSPILRGLRCTIATVAADTKTGTDPESMQWAQQRLSQAGFDVETRQLEGEAADALLACADRDGVDMLVMGAYGHSRIRQLVVGSTTTAILRRARLPVFILR